MTMFYSSIFALGAFLDASAKNRRRMELDKDIEAVKTEVQELQNEEARLLSQLSLRWKPRQTAVKRQTRPFSTSATSDAQSIRGKPREAVQVGDLSQERGSDILETGADPSNASGQHNGNERDWDQLDQWPTNGIGVAEQFYRQPGRRRALQYLAMKQLALKLLLRPYVGAGYAGVRLNYNVDIDLRSIDIERMLKELRIIQKKMNYIRKFPDSEFQDVLPLETPEQHARLVEERGDLENQLQDMVDYYKSGGMTLDVLIVRVADNLVASKEPITPRGIVFLLEVFSRTKQKDIVLMIMDSLFPNGFLLTQLAVSETISFFGNTYDLLGFNKFLDRLQDPSSPIVRRQWLWRRVGDVGIPVPPGLPHPYTVTLLIKTALNLDQPHKADAWLEYLRQCGYGDNAKTLIAYIRYYAYQQDWKKGVYFLYRAVKFLRSATFIGRGDTVKRLVLFMAACCNSCGQSKSARVVLKAAVTSGIDSRQIHNDDRFEPVVRTLTQWEEVEAAAEDIQHEPPDATVYNLIARKIEHHFRQKLNAVREKDLKDKELAATVLESEILDEYEQTIFDLRNEVADFKMKLKAASSARKEEQIVRPSPGDVGEPTNSGTHDSVSWPITGKSKTLDGAPPMPENRKTAPPRPQKFVIRHQLTNPITETKSNGDEVNGINVRSKFSLESHKTTPTPGSQKP